MDVGRTTFDRRLDAHGRAALAAVGRLRRFPRGASLTREGALDEQVVVITSGWVKVAVAGHGGTDVVVDLRGPGDVLGEFAALDVASPRAATVVALADVVALVVPGAAFRRLVDERPDVDRALLLDAITRLRAYGGRIAAQGSLPSGARLARLLLDLAQAAGDVAADGTRIGLGLTQGDLAGLLGCSRDSVATALASMRRAGAVATSRRSIVVRDREALERLASPSG